MALYVALAKKGFFKREELMTFCQPHSFFGGHPERNLAYGIEASTGALGHGLSFANGVAYAAKINQNPLHTWVVIGDGECQEGSVWEAALFAAQHRLDNLTVIIDFKRCRRLIRSIVF